MLNKFFKKTIIISIISIIFIFGMSIFINKNKMPDDFVYLSDIDPTIIQSTRYYTENNFLARVVNGYQSKEMMCTKSAAEALKLVQGEMNSKGYNLVVYDAYRPQRAVDDFIKWSKDSKDQAAKLYYYPYIDKENVFELGYVAKKSSHSRGSTFDLSIIPLQNEVTPIKAYIRTLTNGQEIYFLDDGSVDMGASFDLFHEISHHGTNLITKEQEQMRNLLKDTMKKYGFNEYQEEWWHYTLSNEQYPDTYFNFVVVDKP